VVSTRFVVIVIIPVLTLAACGSSPSASQTEHAKNNIPPATVAATNNTETIATANGAGLGPIVFDDRTRKECARRARPGSRIHRPECDPDDRLDTIAGAMTDRLARAPINQLRVAK
jgi:hypothetical protein